MKPIAWASFSEGEVMMRDMAKGPSVWWNQASAESASPSGTAVPLYTLAQVAEMLEAEGLAWEKVAPHAGSYSMGWAADWLRAKETGTP